MQITLSFYGEGIRYWICDMDTALYKLLEEASRNLNNSLDTLLFDLDFLKKIGFSSWDELRTEKTEKSFIIAPANRLEIRKEKKILLRIPSNDLLPGFTLFPLYQTVIKSFTTIPIAENKHRLILYQYETGLFFKFKFETSVFHVEDLRFNLTESLPFHSSTTISGISYPDTIVNSLSDDTLTRSSRVYNQ